MGRPDPQLKDSILAHLRQNHPGMCRHWFEDIESLDLTGGTFRLLVREPIQLRYLQRSCVEQFTEAAQAVTNRLLAVRFVGEGDEIERPAEIAEPAGEDGMVPLAQPGDLVRMSPNDDMLISPDYSFANFVVGPGNRLAHAAAFAVGQKPGRAYNPLFIHGGVGLGKTHLLQAVCQAAIHTHRHMQIYYVSCNGFMTQFVEAVQAGQMTGFRHRFRNIDLLVIDDIHDLSKRNRTQEEFFHTFNSLYQAGKQIVLSSDAPPGEIPDLEERLISRFNCGLVAQIDKPDYETRVAIIKAKATMRNLELPDDVASYIAGRLDTNIRELEGAITKLQGLAMLEDNPPLDLALAKQAVGGPPSSQPSHHPTVQEIIDTVTEYYGVKLTDLLSKRRQKSIALPRQVGMWLTRQHTRHSLEEIGGYFGGRDHTTVMHAIKTIDFKRGVDAIVQSDVAQLNEQLRLRRPHAGLEAPPPIHS
ncbi:MAG: chromosomal replication initiator protein DnaA [Phycisphaerales bacterium]|nr:MAG: chromosomal replication initiator protein DnaA [Phycisphaerales bacterium]